MYVSIYIYTCIGMTTIYQCMYAYIAYGPDKGLCALAFHTRSIELFLMGIEHNVCCCVCVGVGRGIGLYIVELGVGVGIGC